LSLRLFVIYLDYRLYSSILFKMEVCGLQEEVLKKRKQGMRVIRSKKLALSRSYIGN
jgi:hypothetical protein